MEWFFSLLLLVASLEQGKSVNTVYIQPASYNLSDYTLQDYIDDTEETRFHNSQQAHYNNSVLLLLPGEHVLQTDFIVQNAYNFAIYGNDSKIYCNKSFLGIAFINAIRIILTNVEIINCGKDYVLKSNSKQTITSAVYFNQCTDVNVYGISILVNSGTHGMIAENTNASPKNRKSIFRDTTIATNCANETSLLSTGLLIYYHDYYSQTIPEYCKVQLSNYKYKNIGLCKESLALNIATYQTTFNVSIEVFNTKFNFLNNSAVLNYHGESCGALVRSILIFNKCSIEHNQGDGHLKLFLFVIFNQGYIFGSSLKNVFACDKQINVIYFRNCTFVNNSNMRSIINIYILLKYSLSANVLIAITDSIFVYNYGTKLIMSKAKALWQLTHSIILKNVRISSNRFKGHSLISFTNGVMKFLKSVIISNNTYHVIIKHYFSLCIFEGYSEISANDAYFILDSRRVSYYSYIVKEYSIINITKNTVYSVMNIDSAIAWNDKSKPVCCFQFISNKTDLERHFDENGVLNYQIDFIDNVYSAPKYHVQESNKYYEDCLWLNDTAFSSTNSSEVFRKVIKSTIKYANRTHMTKLLTICPCFNISVYNCSQRYIGTVSPGQTLTIKLKLATIHPFKTTYITAFSRTREIPQACHLLNAFEIEQEHQSHRCNEHNYTIWSNLSECELLLHLSKEEIVEVFYVKLRACPAGFVLGRQKGACYCDPTLHPYVTSCDLHAETILRPANSWVFAYKANQKYEYKVSKLCPYNHCLPHPSHLNLSMPDSQCRSHRTGLLCSQCQQDLSNVFGSSQCKQCSNFYLFIIIPIAIAGVVLVMMLFIFNLTVTSGTINTFIFYVNIISINYSIVYPDCKSLDCVLLSLSNLDLGFELCFYNGMDSYSKILLQLTFPFYLIFIAFMLIIGSRYSAKIQRITSQRALHVLATLFLLSYTKFLLTVCQVLFFYSAITHLPSKHITLLWSLDATVPLFGIKFLIAFLICLVIFIILLHFNFLSLFARKLLRFKYINTFKPLIDTYFGPYKDRFYYWTGLQLILRAIFFGLSALRRNINLTSGIIILGILICLQCLVCPFKSRYKNIQEALVLLNLQVVYVLALYSNDNSNANIKIMQVLILLVLIYFFTVVSYHCLMSISMCSNVINKVIIHLQVVKDKLFTSRNFFDTIMLKDADKPISGNYHEFQEPLIALDN